MWFPWTYCVAVGFLVAEVDLLSWTDGDVNSTRNEYGPFLLLVNEKNK